MSHDCSRAQLWRRVAAGAFALPRRSLFQLESGCRARHAHAFTAALRFVSRVACTWWKRCGEKFG